MKSWFQKLRESLTGGRSPAGQGEYIDVEPEDAAAGVTGAQSNTGVLSRLQHGSKRDRQIAALQAGYTELLDLIRAIREHLDAQAQAQGRVLESMDKFNDTLSLMDQTSRKSAQTMIELARKTRESEDLLRTMVVRSERRLTVLMGLLLVILLAILGFGVYFGYRVMDRQVETTVVAEKEPAPAPAAQPPAEGEEPVSLELTVDEAVELVIGEAAIESAAIKAEKEQSPEPEPASATEEEDAEERGGPFGGRRGFLFFGR